MRKEVILAILFLVFLNISLVSASNDILLKSRHFVPAEGITDATKSKIEAIPERAHVLIQLEYIPTPEDRKKLEAHGIKLLSYIPNKAWFASIPSNKTSEIAEFSDVNSIGEILVEDKIAPEIRENGINNYSTNEKGEAKLVVIFFNDISLKEASKIIEAYNGTLIGEAPIINALVIFLPKNKIYELAAHDSVQWINQHYKFKLTNDGSRAAIGVNAVQEAPYNLKGSNITAGEWDGGCVNDTHPDLKGRVILANCDTGPDRIHATHVAGTMMGNGNLSEVKGGTPLQWRGMATNATVVSYVRWSDVSMLYSNYSEAINTYHIDLSTNSFGIFTSSSGVYDENSKAIDNITIGAFGKKIPIMWAAGNNRPYCDNEQYDCINIAGTAKNTITVGGINSNDDSMTQSSSWGPTDDGRIKPDVVAASCENDTYKDDSNPDKSIWSTVPFDQYYGDCGTSMSTPAVSGSVALMLENWRRNYDEDPLPSTIKAILMQTAKDLGNIGPDYSYGYGRINVTKTIDLMNFDNDTNNNIILEDSIVEQDDKDNFAVVVPQGQSEFKITLVWDDYPGTVNADPALVNDLDLIVKAPNGIRYYPWTLDRNNPGNSAVRIQSDHINNVEQVYVNTTYYGSEINGTWLIEVNGTAVPEPEQAYSLVTNIGTLTYTPIDACGILDEPEKTYVLQKDLSINGTCFLVQANNIIIDFAGYNITGNGSLNTYGIYSNGYNYTTIKNGKIYDFDSGIYLLNNKDNNVTNITANSNYHGIFLNLSSNNNITSITANSNEAGVYVYNYSNNNILTNVIANNNYVTGVYLKSSNNNQLTNITANSNYRGIAIYSSSNNTLTGITANNSPYDEGIVLYSSSNNILTNITANSNGDGILLSLSPNNILTNITTNSNMAGINFYSSSNNTLTGITTNSNVIGIYLYSSSNNNLTSINIWNCTATYYGCLHLNNGDNNTISNGIINLASSSLIYIDTNSDNNIFRDLTLLDATKNDTFLTTTSVNNTFLNVSYNISREYVDSNSELIRKWWYRAYVNDTSGNNISNANVTAYNVSGGYQFNLTTDSIGYTPLNSIIDYINNNATKNYYSPYNISATYLSANIIHTFNASLGNNLEDVFTLLPPPNDTSKFYIKNSTENNVAWLGNEGNLVLAGECYNLTDIDATNLTAPDDSFVIKNASNDDVAYIDGYGDLYISKGSCKGAELASSCPSENAFTIQNSSEESVISFGYDGSLCLKGGMYEYADDSLLGN